MTDQNRAIIVEELISLISKGNAHASFEDAVEGVSLDLLHNAYHTGEIIVICRLLNNWK